MYQQAAKYRADRKAKAERMASGSSAKPDSSDWTQAGPLDADVQTGERPISRRQFKSGGKVSGDLAQIRADRVPRSSGGWAKEFINRDVKSANEDRAGTKHVGGFAGGGNVGDTVPTSRLAFTGGESRLSKAAGLKKGGRTAKNIGGSLEMLSPALMLANAIRGDKDKDAGSAQVVGRKSGGKVDASVSGTKITGGRTPRATGGGTGKDAKGHGSNRRATGIVEHHGSTHEVNIGPSRAAVAASRGWGSAVSMARPGEVAKIHENMGKARARLESHPGFKGWKGEGNGFASGGRTKGKMNVNIIIGQPPAQNAPPPMVNAPVPPPPQMMAPKPMPAPPPQMAGPPPGVGAPPPMPMGRKRGGRTYPIDAGAGGGEGRLEKIKAYGDKA